MYRESKLAYPYLPRRNQFMRMAVGRTWRYTQSQNLNLPFFSVVIKGLCQFTKPATGVEFQQQAHATNNSLRICCRSKLLSHAI